MNYKQLENETHATIKALENAHTEVMTECVDYDCEKCPYYLGKKCVSRILMNIQNGVKRRCRELADDRGEKKW